jgi:hypothetical protein
LSQSSIIGSHSNGGLLTPGTTYPVGGWFQWGNNNGSWLARACPIKAQVQPLPCLELTKEANFYDNPIIPLTEQIQYPTIESPKVPNETPITTYEAGTKFRADQRYQYTVSIHPNEDSSFGSEHIIRVTHVDTGGGLVPLDPPLWFNRQVNNEIITNDLTPTCTLVQSNKFSSSTPRYEHIENLREYDVEIEEEQGKPWTPDELAEIFTAVVNTATALKTESDDTGIGLRRIFRQIIVADEDIPSPNVYFSFLRLPTDAPATHNTDHRDYSTDYASVSSGACLTRNASITCRGTPYEPNPALGGVAVFEYVIVHEFGHVFDNRSDGELSQEIEESDRDCYENGTIIPDSSIVNPSGDCIIDNNNVLVMGLQGEWRRGERGWGSGPSSSSTIFQQHPPSINVEFPGNDYQEAAADMFLNWVYRTNGAGGFENRNWHPRDDCDTPAGCLDASNPGDARHVWMTYRIEQIFTTEGW